MLTDLTRRALCSIQRDGLQPAPRSSVAMAFVALPWWQKARSAVSILTWKCWHCPPQTAASRHAQFSLLLPSGVCAGSSSKEELKPFLVSSHMAASTVCMSSLHRLSSAAAARVSSCRRSSVPIRPCEYPPAHFGSRRRFCSTAISRLSAWQSAKQKNRCDRRAATSVLRRPRRGGMSANLQCRQEADCRFRALHSPSLKKSPSEFRDRTVRKANRPDRERRSSRGVQSA